MEKLSIKLLDIPGEVLEHICSYLLNDHKSLNNLYSVNTDLQSIILSTIHYMALPQNPCYDIDYIPKENQALLQQLIKYGYIGICIDDSRITDVSRLGSVHTLDLSGCQNITDASTLGSVHTLNLSWCQGITDVSTLGGVHTLDLSWCHGITDVSMLGNVHTLYLRKCQGITDVSMLGNVVYTLDLSRC